VSSGTVLQAYRMLEDSRLIEARPRSGYFVSKVDLGDRVRAGAKIGALEMRAEAGEVSDSIELRAAGAGIVIGIARNPLVHVGDPLIHVANLGARDKEAADRDGLERARSEKFAL